MVIFETIEEKPWRYTFGLAVRIKTQQIFFFILAQMTSVRDIFGNGCDLWVILLLFASIES